MVTQSFTTALENTIYMVRGSYLDFIGGGVGVGSRNLAHRNRA